jgi:hypothetical protein
LDANLKVIQDVTRVRPWSYNGPTRVLVPTARNWRTCTRTRIASTVTAAYQSGNASILGTTKADFKSTFCAPFRRPIPTYYYVRMWGHNNGTATWSQSSDSIDECFPFHWEKITAYGAFSGF